MFLLFPGGKHKALTFSYDDGHVFDRKLAEIFRSHKMSATFHLNSGKLQKEAERTDDTYVTVEELSDTYAGHEIACHGVWHRNPVGLSDTEKHIEFAEDRRALEAMTGGLVQGLSYAYGAYDESTLNVVRMAGIKYSRTVESTGRFEIPKDFLRWHPTCHHADPKLWDLAEDFLRAPEWLELPLFYVWGHSYEFGYPDDWTIIEQLTDKLAGKDDIWYATNGEICEYVEATRRLEYSADGKIVKNPSAVAIYFRVGGKEYMLPAGKCVEI